MDARPPLRKPSKTAAEIQHEKNLASTACSLMVVESCLALPATHSPAESPRFSRVRRHKGLSPADLNGSDPSPVKGSWLGSSLSQRSRSSPRPSTGNCTQGGPTHSPNPWHLGGCLSWVLLAALAPPTSVAMHLQPTSIERRTSAWRRERPQLSARVQGVGSCGVEQLQGAGGRQTRAQGGTSYTQNPLCRPSETKERRQRLVSFSRR